MLPTAIAGDRTHDVPWATAHEQLSAVVLQSQATYFRNFLYFHLNGIAIFSVKKSS